MHASRAKQI